MKRFLVFGVLGLLAFATVQADRVHAQNYPTQPIQMVVPMAPGDTVDITGRAIANELTKILGQPVLTVNKTGGGGTIGADFVAKAKKDGYTVLFANSNIYYAHAMDPETCPYNPLTDLEPLCLAIAVPLTIPVQAESPWKSFKELMDYMKANPGKIRGSSSGVGSVGHFNFEIVRMETGNEISMIPYKGASPAMVALLGGHVETSTLSISLIGPQVAAGKLRVLAISQKAPHYPNIPTLKELGYKQDLMSVRFAFYVPAGMSDAIKKVLIPAVEKAIKAPEVAKVISDQGAIADFVPGPEFKKMMTEEHDLAMKHLKGKGPAPVKK